MTPDLALVTLWALLSVYSVLVALDLGAGAYLGWAHLRREAGMVRVVERYATPVWEAVNSLLVLLLLGMEAFFPRIINIYASILLVPLALTLALLSARSVAFAMRHIGTPGGGAVGRRGVTYLAGAIGLLVPLPAMTFFAVLEGKGFRIVDGVIHYSLLGLVTQPLTLSLMLLALCAELHLGAVFLRWFAERMGETDARRQLGRIATVLSGPVAAAALLVLVVLLVTIPSAAPSVRAAWPLWLVALVGLSATTFLVVRDRGGPWPLVATAVMYFGGYMALGVTQLPYLVRGQVTAAQAFTSSTMAGALGIVFVLGFLVVVLPCALLLGAYLVTGARAGTGG